MNSIKEWFSGVWAKVSAALAIVLGLVWYYVNLRNKKIEALQAKLDQVDTQRKSDILEAEIKQKLDQEDMLKKEAQEHERLLVDLEKKRQELPNAPDLKPNEAVDYWNKK